MNAEKTDIRIFTKKSRNNKIYTIIKIMSKILHEHIKSNTWMTKGYTNLKCLYTLLVSEKLEKQKKILLYQSIVRLVLPFEDSG